MSSQQPTGLNPKNFRPSAGSSSSATEPVTYYEVKGNLVAGEPAAPPSGLYAYKNKNK